VPPALAAWACAAIAREIAPVAVLAVAIPLLVAGVGTAVGSGRRSRPVRRLARHSPVASRPAPRPAPLVAAMALACACAGAADTALRRIALVDGPVAALAERGASVDADLVVTADPRPAREPATGGSPRSPAAGSSRPAGRPPLTVAPARLIVLTSGRLRVRQRVAVLVLASGGGWDDALPSQRVRISGRLAAAGPGDSVAAVVFVRRPPTYLGRASPDQRVAGYLRARLRRAAASSPGGLLPGLVTGDTRGLDPSVDADFRTAGMTHLLAVSGANMMIVLDAVLVVLRRLGVSRRGCAAAAGCALAGFVLVARPSPSVLRAGSMALLGVVALASGRPAAALPVLATAVGTMVLIQPDLAVSAGFALSSLATAGLIVLAPPWARAWERRAPRVLAPLAEPIAVACAAFVACVPVVAALAGQISLVSVPANVCAEVVVAPTTLLGLVTALVAPVSVRAARLPAALAGIGCRWLIVIAHTAARIPTGQIGWPGGGVGLVAAAGAVAGCALAVRHRTGRRLLLAAGAGAALYRVARLPW